MSDIRQARHRLMSLQDRVTQEQADEIEEILRLMNRRPPAKPVARRKAAPVDQQTAYKIRVFAKKNPEMSNLEIAAHFKTGPGRVSEALHHLK